MKSNRPEDIFRAEKERAVSARNSQHARLLAEAKAAFDKLMAEGQAARKSGRPRKHPLPPLKTSSSRTPPRAPTPPPAVAVKVAAPAKPVAVAPPARPAAPAAAKGKGAHKSTARSGSKRPASSSKGSSKTKSKSKRSDRR